MRIVFLLFSFFIFTTVSAKEVVIKLSLADCINCVKYLNDVSKIEQEQPVTFILEGKYEPDAALIEKQYALH